MDSFRYPMNSSSLLLVRSESWGDGATMNIELRFPWSSQPQNVWILISIVAVPWVSILFLFFLFVFFFSEEKILLLCVVGFFFSFLKWNLRKGINICKQIHSSLPRSHPMNPGWLDRIFRLMHPCCSFVRFQLNGYPFPKRSTTRSQATSGLK